MNHIIKRLTRPDLQVKYILKAYSLASKGEISEGLSWYKIANKLCRGLALKYDLRLAQVVGIVSALSPGVSWGQNIIDAVNLIDTMSKGRDYNTVTVNTYPVGKFKAIDIFEANLFHKDIYKLLLGSSKVINKTSSFYLNILNPKDNNRVTVDRHSIRVALGSSQILKQKVTEKRYLSSQEAYIKAGAKVGLTGVEIQAVTWITFRNILFN